MSEQANIGPRIELEGQSAYKQSLTDCNKSMQSLRSELRAVAVEFDGNANSADALRAKNELLTKQQVEQEKKLALLRGALAQANTEYGEGSAQVQNWQIKLNNAYAELNRLNKTLNSNEAYLKEAEKSTDKTASSIDGYGKKVKEAEKKTLSFGDVLKANLTGTAIIAGVEALGNSLKNVATQMVRLVTDTASYADNILTLNAQTGISTDKLQELQYMQELTDVSLETTTNSMAKQIKSMANAQKGTDSYVAAYAKLGVAVTGSNGALRDSDTVFWEAIDALGQMANETERDATAMLLFGKSAQDLNPLIKIGSAGVAEFAEEARKAGAVLSTDTLTALGQTDDALQRLSAQYEITKRKVGISMAPAMTDAFEKITDKLDEADDKIADFASGSLTDAVDLFIWIVDNADLIAAGLKGVGAAFVTKKAADGITYAVQAYQTLTTVTEVATGAQMAFNTATKANIIGLIASAVIGLGTAFISYTASTNDAAKATEETASAYDKLNESIQKNIESRVDNKKIIETEYGAVQTLSDNLYKLANQEDKSNGKKQEMVALVNEINKAMPDLNLSINEQTGLLNLQQEAVNKLITSSLEYAEVQAAQEKLTQIATDKFNAEQALNDMYEDRITKETKINELLVVQNKMLELEDKGYVFLNKSEKDYYNTNKDVFNQLEILANEFINFDQDITNAKISVSNLGDEWNETTKYIRDHSAIDGAAASLESFSAKYAAALEAQTTEELGTLDDRIEKINKTYEKSSKNLEDRLEDEQDAFEEAQEAEVDAVKEASDKELKTLEKAHKKKLELIDEEYLAKIKLVDEERYKELKKVQDQIDDIDTKQEAEDRAAQLKDEAEKKAELQTKVSTATTLEDKLDAQKELAEYEEEIAADRLKTERGLQKDILEEQKDTIDEAYDAKITALEDAETKEKEKIDAAYENEKIAIADRLELKLGEIEAAQKLEQEAFDDKQEALKIELADEKELALKNADEIYEEDLAKFKLNNALKYNAAVENEQKIQDIMKQYTLDNIDIPGITSEYNFSDWPKIQQSVATGNYTASNSAGISLDYDLLTDAMVDALKNMNLTVVLDDKKIGKIIDDYVAKSLK